MKKSRLFAPFIMLFAGAVTSIVMFKGNYDTTYVLIMLLCVMVVFYLAGCLIQKKVFSFIEQIREKEAAEAENEGEVIEKEVPAADENGMEA